MMITEPFEYFSENGHLLMKEQQLPPFHLVLGGHFYRLHHGPILLAIQHTWGGVLQPINHQAPLLDTAMKA